ncbi:RagB/SusD family nutrient uptake outer membrane protein [Labilibacter sediminis]|nr:RagB/SusD family nutrient uptake outer membrane protein [Labilibacter sediminis]
MIFKNKKIMQNQIIIFIVVAFTLSSCEDYFDNAQLPAILVTDDWQNNDDLEKITSSAYYLWKGYNEGISDMSIVIPSFTSDEGILSAENDQNILYGNHDLLYLRETDDNSIPYLERIWQSGYEVVRMSNIGLKHLNEFGTFKTKPNSQWEDRLKGENYFCRAFAFYSLIKTFAPPYDANGDMSIPGIIIETVNPEGAYDTKPLKTVQEAYNQILADVDSAIAYLPEAYDADRDPEAYQDRAKRDAAHFLKARIYFQMGPEYWEQSLAQIDIVLGDGKYPLAVDPADAFEKDELGAISTETVFQYVNYAAGQQWRRPAMHRYFEASQSGRMFHMNESFAQFIGWDTNAVAMADLRFTSLFTNLSSGIWVSKWKNSKHAVPMMRSPELHLTRAIICLLSGLGGGDSQAIADLNVVRERAYGGGYIPLDNSTTTEELIDITHRERAIELFFEGDRLFYLQAIRGKVNPGERTDQTVLEWNSDKLYWKIPEREMNLNNNIH